MEESPAWLEVSLVVDGELAEAIADVLGRFVPNGVVIESTSIRADSDDEGRPAGPLRISGYLPVNDKLGETRQRLEEALWYLGRIQPLPTAQYRQIMETNWAEAWKIHFHPIDIGSRLTIVPAWLENPNVARIPIRIDPGMAFGTGTHPTTQLCLEILEAFMFARPEESLNVIDLGCGSGILCIAALKLGAQHALGVDIDPQAIRVARENAERNGVDDRLELAQGSLADIRLRSFSVHKAPLVLANILAPVLVRLLGEGLSELLAAGGLLVLSGILEEQAEEVEAALRLRGLRPAARRQQGDWVAIEATWPLA
jgi:ribosomal protein L11 methyltransferase